MRILYKFNRDFAVSHFLKRIFAYFAYLISVEHIKIARINTLVGLYNILNVAAAERAAHFGRSAEHHGQLIVYMAYTYIISLQKVGKPKIKYLYEKLGIVLGRQAVCTLTAFR